MVIRRVRNSGRVRGRISSKIRRKVPIKEVSLAARQAALEKQQEAAAKKAQFEALKKDLERIKMYVPFGIDLERIRKGDTKYLKRVEDTANKYAKAGIKIREYISNKNLQVKRNPDGTLKSISAKPVEYKKRYQYQKQPSGTVNKREEKDKYVPLEIKFDSTGNPRQLIKRTTVEYIKDTDRDSGYEIRTETRRVEPTEIVDFDTKGNPLRKQIFKKYRKSKKRKGDTQKVFYDTAKIQDIDYSKGTIEQKRTPRTKLEFAPRNRKIESIIKKTGNKGKITVGQVQKNPALLIQMEKKLVREGKFKPSSSEIASLIRNTGNKGKIKVSQVKKNLDLYFQLKRRRLKIPASLPSKKQGLDSSKQNLLSSAGITMAEYAKLPKKKKNIALTVAKDLAESNIKVKKREFREAMKAKNLTEAMRYLRGVSSVSEKFEKKVEPTLKGERWRNSKIMTPNLLLELIQEKNVEQRRKIYDKYYKNENVTYINPKTGKIKFVRFVDPVTFEFRDIYHDKKGSAKKYTDKQKYFYMRGFALAKMESQAAHKRFKEESLKPFIDSFKVSDKNIKTQFKPFFNPRSGGFRTTVYNKRKDTIEIIEGNTKTGKTKKKAILSNNYIFHKLKNMAFNVGKYITKSGFNLAVLVKNGASSLTDMYRLSVMSNTIKNNKIIIASLYEYGHRDKARKIEKQTLMLEKKADVLYQKLMNRYRKNISYFNKSTGLTKGLVKFVSTFLKGMAKTGASISSQLMGITQATKLYKEKKELEKYRKKITKNDKQPTKKEVEVLITKVNNYDNRLKRFEKVYKNARKDWYSNESKFFRTLITWATIFGVLGKIANLKNVTGVIKNVTIRGKKIPLRASRLRKIGLGAELGIYGLETKFTLDAYRAFVRNPTSLNLSMVILYSTPVIIKGIRTGKRLSPKYISNIHELRPSLRYNKLQQKALKNYIKVESKKINLLQTSKFKTKAKKALQKAKKDLEFLKKQEKRISELLRDPLKIDTVEINEVKPVAKWMQDVWNKALKKQKVKLYHVSPLPKRELLKKGYKPVEEARIYREILKKVGKIKVKKLGKIDPINIVEDFALPIFKKNKVIIGGGRALNARVSFFRRRRTPDLDAKISSGAKKILSKVVKKANAKLKFKEFFVKPGGHPGTFKIVNKKGQVFIELTNTPNLKKINFDLNPQGLRIESLDDLLKGKANALSKIERLYRKGVKDIGDVSRLTEGKVTKKFMKKLLTTQKGEMIVSGVERFGKKFMGKRRTKLSKKAGVPIDPMYYDFSAGIYYGKPNSGFVRISPKSKTIFVYDGATLSRFPTSLQKRWQNFFRKNASSKQYYKLVKDSQNYINKNPNKFFSGYPKSNTLIDEKEILLAKNSILKIREQKFFTYIEGEKYSVLKIGFTKPPKMSIVDIFKKTYGKYKLKELGFRLRNKNFMDEIKSLSKYVKRRPTKTNRLVLKKVKNKLKNAFDKIKTLPSFKNNITQIKSFLKRLGIRFKEKKSIKPKKIGHRQVFEKKQRKRRLKKIKKESKKAKKRIKQTEKFKEKLNSFYKRNRLRLIRGEKILLPFYIARQIKERTKYITPRALRKIERRLRIKPSRQIRRISKRTSRTRKVKRTSRTRKVKRTPRTRKVKRTSRTRKVKRTPRTRKVKRTPRTRKVKRTPRTRKVKRTPRTRETERIPPPYLLNFKDYDPKKKGRSYDVGVKKKGAKSKYQKVGIGRLSKKSARRLGRYITDNTRLASYIIVPNPKPIKNTFRKKTGRYKFRRTKSRSKLPFKAYVEKAKYRIDTVGEKRQITLKGLSKLRSTKSLMKQLSNKKRKIRSSKIKKKKKKRSKRKKTNRKTPKKRVKRRKTNRTKRRK